MVASIRPGRPGQLKLTDPRQTARPEDLRLLSLLAEYRFLTTSQFQHKVGATTEAQANKTYRELERLRRHGRISSFPWLPEQGNNSELCWLLTREGVRELEENTSLRLVYNSHYQRHPSRERIRFRSLELELESQIVGAGWKVLRPLTYNQHRPLPSPTPQFKSLAQVLTLREERRRPGTQLDPKGPHTLVIPLKLNEYVAQSQEGSRGAVFVLAPPKVSRRFWESRIEGYRLLARELNVVGVFANERVAVAYKALLEGGKLKVTTLERVGKGLSAISA